MKLRIFALVIAGLLYKTATAMDIFYLSPGKEVSGYPLSLHSDTILIKVGEVLRVPIVEILEIRKSSEIIHGPFDFKKLKSIYPSVPVDTIKQNASQPIESQIPNETEVHSDTGFIPLFQREKGFHLSIKLKPVNYALSKILEKENVPIPARIAAIAFRPYGPVGIVFEPQIISNSKDGSGFVIGVEVYGAEALNGDPFISVGLKWDHVSLGGWGDYESYLLEFTKDFIGKGVMVAIGAEIGFGLTGLSNNPDKKSESGIKAGVVLDIGFGI